MFPRFFQHLRTRCIGTTIVTTINNVLHTSYIYLYRIIVLHRRFFFFRIISYRYVWHYYFSHEIRPSKLIFNDFSTILSANGSRRFVIIRRKKKITYRDDHNIIGFNDFLTLEYIYDSDKSHDCTRCNSSGSTT